MQAPERTPNLLTYLGRFAGEVVFRGRLLLMSEYFLGQSGLKLRKFSADGQRMLFCKNRGSSNFCARLVERRNLRKPLHPSGEIYKFFRTVWLVKFPCRPADCAAVFISLPISFLPSGPLMYQMLLPGRRR